MEQIKPIRTIVTSMLSGDPSKSLEDSIKIIRYLRSLINLNALTDLIEMQVNSNAWHLLFSADLYLNLQLHKIKHSPQAHKQWKQYLPKSPTRL